MNDGDDKQQASGALRILHGGRSLAPAEAAEALRPYLEAMRRTNTGDKLADASIAAVSELVRSLEETTQPRTISGKKPSRPLSALRTQAEAIAKEVLWTLMKPCERSKGWPVLRSQASRGSQPKCSQISSAGL